MERLQRLALKHGARALKFFENPTVRITNQGMGAKAAGGEASGANIADGCIIAALIIGAALLGNESDLERWVRSGVHLPGLPLLSLACLAGAACLWLRLLLRNRHRKGD